MLDIKKLISAYDLLRDDDWKIPVYKMTDEEIDNLLDLQWELLDQLPILIAHKKQQAMIRLKAEKEEESCDTLLKRIFTRLWIEDFDCEYGKAKKTMNTKYDVNELELPKDFFMPNHAKIRWLVNKNESIDWVTPIQSFLWVRVS